MAASLKSKLSGFTLIEMIAGIVIMAIAMTAMTAVLFPHARGSVDPIFQVRAAELGQSLLNQITSKAFDENTQLNNGLRCGEAPALNCSATMGPDGGEGVVGQYDDVDDFNGYNQNQAQLDSLTTYATLYPNFSFSIEVFYDSDYNGVADAANAIKTLKRIEVRVTTPGDEIYDFAAFKGNY